MAWPYTTGVTWGHGEEPCTFTNQPVDADTALLEGCPLGFRAGSTPANCVRACAAGDDFAGFAERAADNTVASASQPNLLYNQNVGDGTTGANGAKVRCRTGGLVRLEKSKVPNGSGTIGSGITGSAGTQADVGSKVYYNGSGFTLTSTNNTEVGRIVAVGTTVFGTIYHDIRLPSVDTDTSP